MPVAQRRRVGRLPYHRVAHQGRRGRQVAADGGEVERRDGVDEPLQGAVVQPVPGPRRGVGLLRVDPLGVGHVEPQEVDQLAGAVDLRLVRRFALPEHGGRVEPLPPLSGQHVGRLEEHRRSVLEPPMAPLALRLDRGGHGGVDCRRIGLVQPGQHARMAVGRDDVLSDAAPDLATTDHGRDLGPLIPHRGERALERRPLGRAGRIAQDWLVVGMGDIGDTAHEDVRARGA